MEGDNTGRAGREALPRSSPEPLKLLAAGAVGQELAHHVFEQSPMPTYSVCGRTACLEICYRRMQEIIWCFCDISAVKGLPRVQQISSTGHGHWALLSKQSSIARPMTREEYHLTELDIS